MTSALKIMSAAAVAMMSSSVFANPLDLSQDVQSVVCTGSNAKLEYQASTKSVVVTNGQASKTYTLTSLKKTVGGSQLVAQSPADNQHVVATIRNDGGRSLVQVDGTYFYARCEVK